MIKIRGTPPRAPWRARAGGLRSPEAALSTSSRVFLCWLAVDLKLAPPNFEILAIFSCIAVIIWLNLVPTKDILPTQNVFSA